MDFDITEHDGKYNLTINYRDCTGSHYIGWFNEKDLFTAIKKQLKKQHEKYQNSIKEEIARLEKLKDELD